jgi:hypothetical protein
LPVATFLWFAVATLWLVAVLVTNVTGIRHLLIILLTAWSYLLSLFLLGMWLLARRTEKRRAD